MDNQARAQRIAYFCYPPVYSLMIPNLLVRFYDLPIKAFVLSTADGYEQGRALPFHRVAFNTLRHSGVRYAEYELAFSLGGRLALFGMALLDRMGLIRNRLYSFSELARRYALKRYSTPYFSDPATIAWLAGNKINAGLSAFNNQIFRSGLIVIFLGKTLCKSAPRPIAEFQGGRTDCALVSESPSARGCESSRDWRQDR